MAPSEVPLQYPPKTIPKPTIAIQFFYSTDRMLLKNIFFPSPFKIYIPITRVVISKK